MLDKLAPYMLLIKIVAVLALLGGVVAYYNHHVDGLTKAAYDKGSKDKQGEWDKADLEAIATRQAENKVQAAAQAEVNLLIKKGSQNDTAKITATAAADNARGLSYNKSAFCGGSNGSAARTANTESASGSTAADTGSGLLPTEIERDFTAFAEDVELRMTSCRAAQTFILQNGLAP